MVEELNSPKISHVDAGQDQGLDQKAVQGLAAGAKAEAEAAVEASHALLLNQDHAQNLALGQNQPLKVQRCLGVGAGATVVRGKAGPSHDPNRQRRNLNLLNLVIVQMEKKIVLWIARSSYIPDTPFLHRRKLLKCVMNYSFLSPFLFLWDLRIV